METDEDTLFGEGPGAFVVSGPYEAFAAFGSAVTVTERWAATSADAGSAVAARRGSWSGVHAGGLARLMG